MNRTLVKSPPELWSEVSDVESLARHLGEFGEITITRLEPEHTVAWEGEDARGTVELEASGWGTKVTLSAAVAVEQATVESEAVVEEVEVEVAPVEVAARSSWLRRWFRREAAREAPIAVAGPEVVVEPELAPEPEAPDTGPAEAVLETALDNLGAAHHRPFSREG